MSVNKVSTRQPTQRVALISETPSSFVKRDQDLLSERYVVTTVWYRGKRDLPALARAVWRTSINISWFALGYAYTAAVLSRLLRKSNVIIVGGWDVVYEPEIGYGAMSHARRIRLTTKALESASLVIAVSEASKGEALQWASREIEVVPNAVDTEFFRPAGPKSPVVVTAANFENLVRSRVKGMDLFAEVAERLPEVTFRLAGRITPDMMESIRKTMPRNVELLGWLPEQDILREFQQSAVYFQPSFRESFGVAVAEAMACACVPVVSDRKGLPELVGDAGFVCQYGDADGMAQAILKALATSGERARARIEERFSLGIRRERLFRLLEGLP